MARYHSAPLPVYVDGGNVITQGHALGKTWPDAVTNTPGPFLWVCHSPLRHVGRWGCVEVARPFQVRMFPARGKGNRISMSLREYVVARSLTLEQAVARALEVARKYPNH